MMLVSTNPGLDNNATNGKIDATPSVSKKATTNIIPINMANFFFSIEVKKENNLLIMYTLLKNFHKLLQAHFLGQFEPSTQDYSCADYP